MKKENDLSNRRPLKSREQLWSGYLLKLLLKSSITPNQVSLASIGFACLGAAGFAAAGAAGSVGALICAIIGMQGRLLCNLMDGMIAVEGQRASKLGEIYNELPDRVSDIIILIGAGYGYASFTLCSLNGSTLGLSAALLAVLTAYVRILGASLGAGQIYLGPMAKPHRMALLTCACALEITLIILGSWKPLIPYALILMIIGSVVTVHRRLSKIVGHLSRA